MRRSNDRTAATPMSIRRTVAWSRTARLAARSGDVRRQGRSRQLGLEQDVDGELDAKRVADVREDAAGP